MVTIKQIAEKAGVSTATVSNVIHGKIKKVSPATVEKVKKLIEEMGYIQPLGLSVLHKGSSQLVAVIINYHQSYKKNFLGDAFYGMVVGSIEMELRKHGYYMMLHADSDVKSIFTVATTWNVDGLILVSMSDVTCEKLRNMTNKPIVAIDTYNVGKERQSIVPNIGLDDAMGAGLMINHLLERGYEDIYVCYATGYGLDQIRWEGAFNAFEKSGKGSRGCHINKLMVGNSEESREIVLKQITKTLPFKRKTALFYVADFMALEAIRYLKKKGIRIPEDVAIAGYDDDPNIAKFCEPSLTTIHQEFSEKGKKATKHLIRQLENPEYVIPDINLTVSLVCREST